MQTANIMLQIGGDAGNTVPKYNVTAAEIAVLRAIHGEGAVFDIEPVGNINANNRGELSRLRGLYGAARDAENNSILETMFPGAAARVFENLNELELDESFFKPTGRVSASAPKAKAELFGGKGDHDNDGEAGGTAPAEPAVEGLYDMTVAQLKALAETRGVDLGKATKKDDIIAALEAVDADAETDAVVDDDAIAADGEGDMTDTTKGTSLFK